MALLVVSIFMLVLEISMAFWGLFAIFVGRVSLWTYWTSGIPARFAGIVMIAPAPITVAIIALNGGMRHESRLGLVVIEWIFVFACYGFAALIISAAHDGNRSSGQTSFEQRREMARLEERANRRRRRKKKKQAAEEYEVVEPESSRRDYGRSDSRRDRDDDYDDYEDIDDHDDHDDYDRDEDRRDDRRDDYWDEEDEYEAAKTRRRRQILLLSIAGGVLAILGVVMLIIALVGFGKPAARADAGGQKDGREGVEFGSPPKIPSIREGKFVPPKRAQDLTSYVRIVSPPGEFMGQGGTFAYTGAQIRVSGNPLPTVMVHASAAPDVWRLDFAPVQANPLGVGEYTGITRQATAQTPGLYVAKSGRLADKTGGSFRVWEAEFEGNKVTRLAIDFMQTSGDFPQVLYGSVRYNSSYE
jgi:hypothetical protein